MTLSGYINVLDKSEIPTDQGFPIELTGYLEYNDEQYFGNVPLKAWEFYIGGYQPAEKWLKYFRDRIISME